MTKLQRWTIAGTAAILIAAGTCGDPGPNPPAKHKSTCFDAKTGHEVKCKGTVSVP